MVLTQAHAQEFIFPEPIPCFPYETHVMILEDYAEDSLFKGISEQRMYDPTTGGFTQAPYALEFNVNQETGTWSIAQIYSTGFVCLLATGSNFTPTLN